MHALKDHISLASRRIPPQSPTKRRVLSTTAGGANVVRSAVLDALDLGAKAPRTPRRSDGAENTATEDVDESIEIVGPIKTGRLTTGSPKRVLEGPTCTNAAPGAHVQKLQRLGAAPTKSLPFFQTLASLPSAAPGHARTLVHSTTSQDGLGDIPPIPLVALRKKAGKTASKSTGTVTASTSTVPAKLPPIYSYKAYKPSPTIVYTQSEEETNDLIGTLRGPVGFDMEWRVLFRGRGMPSERLTAVIQVSDERYILVIQVSAMTKFPKKLQDLIESADVVKTGANILNDGRKLFRDYGITARNLVELGALARQADPDPDAFQTKTGRRSTRGIISLAKIIERYCGRTLLKGAERMGNWEAALGPAMLDYAANDAHCALMAYKRLLTIAAQHHRVLDPTRYTGSIDSSSEGSMTVESSAVAGGGAATGARTGVVAADKGAQSATPGMRPQFLRAYTMWHVKNLPLEQMCRTLSIAGEDAPLKEGTVISYVVYALQANASLPFDMTRLQDFVKLEIGSWKRHRQWILAAQKEGRGRAVSAEAPTGT